MSIVQKAQMRSTFFLLFCPKTEARLSGILIAMMKATQYVVHSAQCIGFFR